MFKAAKRVRIADNDKARTVRVILEVFVCAAEGSSKPRSREIREEHVLVHGLRHLRFLAENQRKSDNTKVVAAAKVFDVLQRMPPAVAGRMA